MTPVILLTLYEYSISANFVKFWNGSTNFFGAIAENLPYKTSCGKDVYISITNYLFFQKYCKKNIISWLCVVDSLKVIPHI